MIYLSVLLVSPQALILEVRSVAIRRVNKSMSVGDSTVGKGEVIALGQAGG